MSRRINKPRGIEPKPFMTMEGAETPPEEDSATAMSLEDLTPDTHNRRRRSARSAKMLDESLGSLGPGRSMVIDEDNHILAGNGVAESAARLGMTKVKIVDGDAQTLIAVRRTGLTPDQKRAMALYDNRTSELAEWDPEQLVADAATGKPLAPFFDASELKAFSKTQSTPSGGKVDIAVVETKDVEDTFWISVEGPLPMQSAALEQLRAVMKGIKGVTVELGTVPIEHKWG